MSWLRHLLQRAVILSPAAVTSAAITTHLHLLSGALRHCSHSPNLGEPMVIIRPFYDNLPIVQAWEGKTFHQPRIVTLLRLLFLTTAKGNFTATLKHIPSIKKQSLMRFHNRTLHYFSLSPHQPYGPLPQPQVG